MLEQHDAKSVSSPLGVWLLLAACASAAQGEDRNELEHSLGCHALKAAMAVWVIIADSTQAVGGAGTFESPEGDLTGGPAGRPGTVPDKRSPSQQLPFRTSRGSYPSPRVGAWIEGQALVV